MEKAVQVSAHHVESSPQARHSDGLPTEDGGDGGSDPPPIPHASSTGECQASLDEISPVGARSQTPQNNNPHDGKPSCDVDDVHIWAHTVPAAKVAHLLGSNIEYVIPTSSAS